MTSCVETVDSAVVVEGATTPNIVRADGGYLLAVRAGGEVSVVALDETATVVHSRQLSAASGNARLPSVSATANGFTALWAEGSDIVMRPLDASGLPSGPAARIASVAITEPRPTAATTGTTVAATWMEGATSIAGVLSGETLSRTASVPGVFPAIAAASGTVAVAWSDGGIGGPVQVASLEAIGSATPVAGSAALIKSLTAIEGDFAVAWEDVGDGAEQIRVARVDVGGSVVAEATGAPAAGGSANWPAVAWSGERLAVAYYQFRSAGSPTVFVGFFDGALRAIDNEVSIADGAKYPSVAWGPRSLAVAYSSGGGSVSVSLVTCP